MMARNRMAHWVMASSIGMDSRCPARWARRCADSIRPGAASRSAVVVPLVHNRPRLAGCDLSPVDLATRRFPVCGSVVVCSTIPQPTPQYAHTVFTASLLGAMSSLATPHPFFPAAQGVMR